jgi:hypothetical protein
MKYFTYDLLAAANDWTVQSEEERGRAEAEWAKAVKNYFRDLEKLKTRVSAPALDFFQNGGGESGLHDGRLISASVGDGLDYPADGISPFYLCRRTMTARLEFLNYEQDRLYTFDLRGVRGHQGNLFVEEDRDAKSVGDLYLCEISAENDEASSSGFFSLPAHRSSCSSGGLYSENAALTVNMRSGRCIGLDRV